MHVKQAYIERRERESVMREVALIKGGLENEWDREATGSAVQENDPKTETPWDKVWGAKNITGQGN